MMLITRYASRSRAPALHNTSAPARRLPIPPPGQFSFFYYLIT